MKKIIKKSRDRVKNKIKINFIDIIIKNVYKKKLSRKVFFNDDNEIFF